MASSHYKKSNAIQNHSSNKSEEAVKKFASMMIERMTALKNENWEKGWFNGIAYEGLPQNFSGRTYNASNSFMLQMLSSIENYSMPVFMTFKQAMDNGLRINKGAESFPVVYWDVNIKDAYGKRIDFDDYKKLTKEERANYHVTPFLKYYPVFNIDQTNLKEVKPEKYEALRVKFSIPEIRDDQGMYTHKAIDKMISEQSWLCPINADKITPKAYYSPDRDIIVLPTKAQFKIHSDQEEIYKDGMEYYSTMLHEIAHSTGHPDRLNREGGRYGDPKYAKEELVAELTAAMISNSMGFDSRITDNSAKYLDNWLTGLKEDPKFIVSVMADVNKAADMILDKVDEQRLALGETPYLSKNMVSIDNGNSLEPSFVPAQELIAREPMVSYGNAQEESKEIKAFSQIWNKELTINISNDSISIKGERNQIPSSTLFAKAKDGDSIDNLLTNNLSDQEKREIYPKLPGAKLIESSIEPLYDEDPYGRLVKRGTIDLQKWDLSGVFLSVKEEQDNVLGESKESYAINKKDSEKSEILQQYKKYKEKYPDSLILIRVGNIYELLGQDAVKASEVLGSELIKGSKENSLELTAFNYKALNKALPQLVKAGHRIAICEDTLEIGKTNQVKKNKKEKSSLKNPQKPNNTMATKKKKSDEPVAEKKEEQVKKEITQKQLEELPVGRKIEVKHKDGSVQSFIKSDDKGWDQEKESGKKLKAFGDHEDTTKYINSEYSSKEYTINIIPGVKVEVKKETKTEEKKEEAVKQPREPQMVTVNGDKVSNAHVFTKKDNPEQWYFIAKINDKFLPSVPITEQEAENYRINKNVPEMMDKYYPTKVMPKVSDDAFKAEQKVTGPTGEMTVNKFNVYKESDESSKDYGQYKFFANIDGKNMSVLAKQEDLNAYFDKVKTPAQLVNSVFGEKLQLKGHYEQFKLPEGFNNKEIKFKQEQNTNKMLVYLDMGEAGNTKGKIISYNDWMSYKNQIATKDQIGAKYLGAEINNRVAMKQDNKIAETAQMKMK